jgi:hypothetical protein
VSDLNHGYNELECSRIDLAGAWKRPVALKYTKSLNVHLMIKLKRHCCVLCSLCIWRDIQDQTILCLGDGEESRVGSIYDIVSWEPALCKWASNTLPLCWLCQAEGITWIAGNDITATSATRTANSMRDKLYEIGWFKSLNASIDMFRQRTMTVRMLRVQKLWRWIIRWCSAQEARSRRTCGFRRGSNVVG